MKNYSDRRDFLKLTAAGAATLTLGGLPIPAGAEEKRTLTVAWDTDIDTLDPASFKSIGGYTIQANIYDSPLMWKVEPVAGKPGLSQSKPGEMEGGIAKSFAFEKDGATHRAEHPQGREIPQRQAGQRDCREVSVRSRPAVPGLHAYPLPSSAARH